MSPSITREKDDACSVAHAGRGMVPVAADVCSGAGGGNIIVPVASRGWKVYTRVVGVMIAEEVTTSGGRVSNFPLPQDRRQTDDPP